MATNPITGRWRPIRKVLEVQSLRDTNDPELVRRFVESGDEASFRVIAERHGPMVLGICGRALGCPYDADDAFQATFLVFARKAASISKTGSLASWFHGVSMRVASKLLRDRTRRKRREHSAARLPARNAAEELTWAEVKSGLDDELHRLPEKYRNVLILCYLEGKTRDEAARQLDLTLSALHGRLERGRRLLADRLTRRGLALSAGLLAVAVAPNSVFTAVRAASLFAANQPVGAMITPRVLTLTNQVLKGMTMSKAKLVLASLACSALLATGVGITKGQPTQNGPKEAPTSDSRNLPSALVQNPKAVEDSDEAFIRRVSQDLRGSAPTTTEVHFFVSSTDAKKRETLIDLFVKERNLKRHEGAAGLTPGESKARAVPEPESKQGPGQKVELVPQRPRAELDVLRLKVASAKLAVREKEMRLKDADTKLKQGLIGQIDVDLRKIELEQAQLLLREAELNLSNFEMSLEPMKPKKTVQPGEGLIGRTLIDGKDIGVVLQYGHGKVFQHEVLEKKVVDKLDAPLPKRGIEVVLQGQLRLSEKTTVRVRMAGGSVSHGVHTLYVDGQEIGSVGDDRQKSGVYDLNLVEGAHTVKWVLTGGRFGNNLLRFEDPASASLLPLTFTSADLKEFAAFPAEDVVRITADERGWPIPDGW